MLSNLPKVTHMCNFRDGGREDGSGKEAKQIVAGAAQEEESTPTPTRAGRGCVAIWSRCAAGHREGASSKSARRAGGSAASAATAAAADEPTPPPPLAAPAAPVSQPAAAPASRPAMSLSGASERSVPATKIEITVSCRNLPDLDTFSKSDPMVVLYTQSQASQEWREFGRTEVIDNTRNPDFVRKFVLDYFFEEKQNLRFDVYNVDSRTNISKPDIATMQLCANKLDKKDFFGKSDPFLVFYRSNEDGTFTICHKTEVVKNTLNPVWQPFSIPVRVLCNGDYDRTVKIDVYDWDRDGSHDFIGEFTTSYRELSKAQNQFTVYEVLNPRKKCKKKKYVNSGTVTLLSFSVDSEFTFVDYIKGGTQLNFTVAIDFTASNGNPLQPTSLHYMSPYQLSAYAMALKAVGEIIQDYDSDKLFPAYGFGAKLPPEGRISHQFPLNNNDEDPNCVGIEGVLESYFQSLRTVQLYGPTYFAPVINQVARAAAKISDGSQYYVLLIITDGVISDMTQTKEAIVSASSLPMSIIIVGVGPAMFEAMEELDGDDVRLSSRGRYAERDIVQFVPFRDYVDRSGNQVLSMARLAKDVLAEIPEQLLSYMRTRDIQPRPPPPANPSPTPAPEHP
nr:copine-9 isoform X2 [Kogia breviceps]